MGISWSTARLWELHKYIYRFGWDPEEYYDLSSDPVERNNLANDERGAERAEQFYEQTAEWFSFTLQRYDGAARGEGR